MERTVDLAELHNHLQICKPLGVWYLELNGVTLVDPSSVTPHTTIISRPWLKSLVIRGLKRSTPDVLVKFLSLFQQIQELHFEGSIGPELHLAPADEDENLERVVVKKLVVHSTYNLPPVSIAESSPKWPGIFIALRKIVQLSGLQTFETNANPWILKEFLQPCEETLRSLTFSVHRTEDNLDFGAFTDTYCWLELSTDRALQVSATSFNFSTYTLPMFSYSFAPLLYGPVTARSRTPSGALSGLLRPSSLKFLRPRTSAPHLERWKPI